MAEVAESLRIPQPDGDPIVLGDAYGHASRYQDMTAILESDPEQPTVAPHLVANIAHSAGREVPVEDAVRAAKDLQTADDLVRLVPNVPIIYHLHCEDAVGVTSANATDGFRMVDTAARREGGSMSHWQTVIPTEKLHTVRTGPNYEDPETVSENSDLEMYAALSFLTTRDPQTRAEFMDYRPDWMRYPNSRIVVGNEAVNGFLEDQARRDLLGEDGDVNGHNFTFSQALLASAALKQMGYDSPIGKHGDIVHEAGVEKVADIVASGLGYNAPMFSWYRGPDSVLRRLIGIDFDAEADAQTVAVKVVERLEGSDKENADFTGNAHQRFRNMIFGDRQQLASYLTETSGSFLNHIVAAETK